VQGVVGSNPATPTIKEDQVALVFFIFIMFHIYILYSSKIDRFYKGQTDNLSNRMKRHNGGFEKFTKNGVPWKLIWSTEKESRSQAKQLESKLKKMNIGSERF
jgi:putative endonuclease